MATDDSNEFEAQLRKFRPRHPAPLETRFVLYRSRKPFWILAAAALAAAMLIALRLDRPAQAPPSAEPMTFGALTTMAVERPEEFDALLARMSQTTLPDVTQPGGALQQLAKF